MGASELVERVWDRLQPDPAVGLAGTSVTVVVLVALVLVGVPALWRVLRLAVTLVHELGHAFVGMATGRQFTGFVLRGDMSGHAVTRGKPRGFGRVATTAAGYPAPAVVGSALVWVAAHGWSAPVLGLVVLALLVALVRVRSGLTLLVVLVVGGGAAALVWWADPGLQAQVVLALGLVLLVGAWRHLAAVSRDHSTQSDPGTLASLTGIPRTMWLLVFTVVCAVATWWAVLEVRTLLGQ